ncbi:MAG: glycosyltransferase family 39 protein [Chthoniobacterales bacterium]
MLRHKWLLVAIAVVAMGVRLIHIDQPFVDNWSWRQSDVAAIARNFEQNGFHFSRPQIDWAGNAEGYVGTEFPVLPFLAALSYKCIGVQEWIGRSQALVFFAASLPFFYLLVRDLFGRTAAVWSVFFLSFAPLSIVAGRAFMPDVPSLSLALVGMYFFQRSIRRDENASLWASAFLLSVSLLIKLPSAVIGAPLFYVAWRRFGFRLFREPRLWLFALIVLVPPAAWYWHAHQIADQFYPHHFFGAGGVRIMSASWYWKIAAQTAGSTLTPVLLVLAVAGAWAMGRTSNALIFHWWFAAMLAFIFVVGWGNRHQWYQLPLVPIAAIYAGFAAARWQQKFGSHRLAAAASAVLIIVAFGASSFLAARPFYAPVARELRELGFELRAITPPDALVVAADNGDPTVFYYAERKGWHFTEDEGIYYGEPSDSAQAISDLDNLRRHGANYLVFTSGTRWWLDYYAEFAEHVSRNAAVVRETDHFLIYRLNPIARATP